MVGFGFTIIVDVPDPTPHSLLALAVTTFEIFEFPRLKY
jgi:hypothetical protein